jgi:prepilin-type N-terminal cleavage/methylation domain-containing protein
MNQRRQQGFSLMEVMMAMSVMAVALTAISTAQHSSMRSGALVYRGEQAALMMRGVVLDIEQEYVADGFPENSVTDRECDLADEYKDDFECNYDLERMNLDLTQMSSIVDQSFGGLLGEGGLGSLEGGGGDMSGTMQNLMGGSSPLAGQVDMSKLAFLMPLMGAEGPAIMDLCGINLSGIMMGFMGMQAIAPRIMEEVGNRTRKLTVRITWDDGPVKGQEFSITTFISALPEEELKKLKEIEDTMGAVNQVAPGLLPGGGGTEPNQGTEEGR